MRAVLTIARLTILEATRRRTVWVLVGLTLLTVVLTTWGVERLVSLARAGTQSELAIFVGVSQMLILVAFMFSFVLAMTAAFLGAPAIAADLESGVAHAILTRPIRRADLVIGRWLGLVVIVAAYAVGSGLLEIGGVRLVAGYAPPEPLLAVAFLAGQAIVLLTVAILLSTRLPAIAGGAICVVLFGLGWMAGVFAGIGRALDAGPLVVVADASRWLLPTDGLWRGTVYGLEPPAVVFVALGRGGAVAQANPFFATSAPSPVFLAWCVVWVVLMLLLAVLSLSR
ncbi:MAG TPA: ABC transporter permease subunit, partial [Candidatus Limnocylindrales bacterium]|nr:ABC transporter permease subunit [Candidatus Limnocylindrales bacterium]